MIKKLNNPLTDDYLSLKEKILSESFPWYWCDRPTIPLQSTNRFGFFSHTIVRRPNDELNYLFPVSVSQYTEITNKVLNQIYDYNNIEVSCVYRINFNLTLPLSDKPVSPHTDHSFPHKNLLIYFTNSGGNTMVLNSDETEECHIPEEDDIIVFEGLHYFNLPEKNRRIILVSTFI